MNLYRVLPPPPEAFSLDREEDRLALAEAYAPRSSQSVRAVMVTDSAGATQGKSGTSNNLSRGADRRLLSIFRESSDAVLVGATTVRTEPVPLPRGTPLVVLCASGDLTNHQIFSRGGPSERLLVVTDPVHQASLAEALGDLPWDLLPTESGLSAHALVSRIRASVSGDHLLVEGGRKVWDFLAPVTTELLVSITPPPQDVGQGVPPWWTGSREDFELCSLYRDDEQMLYYRHVGTSAARPGR